ncbi:MAG: biopolymer transporter ExbD [Deltaproteobacteria bacterium]|nr:biopolymer transporter ExbD [Deltaproteobacteria bacterium]
MAWKTGSRNEKVMSEINITPFTDVMLVLLVIFMVTTPLIMAGSFKVKLPKAVSAGAEEGKGAIVSINEAGAISVNNRPVEMEGLAAALSDEFKRSGKTVIIRADGNVRHSVIVKVLDIARLSGAERLSIAAENVRTK